MSKSLATGSGRRGDAQDRGWGRRGGAPSWWGGGRGSGWEGEERQEVYKVLDGKSGSLQKTYESQAEANNEVEVPIGDAERAMPHMLNIYEKYEGVGKDMVNVGHEVEEKAEYVADKMEEVKQVV